MVTTESTLSPSHDIFETLDAETRVNVRLYPSAGELTVWRPVVLLDTRTQLDHCEDSPDSSKDNLAHRQRAGRRARGRIRRYCAHNDLNRIVTLTYRCRRCDGAGQNRACVCPEGPDRPMSRAEVMADMRNALRRGRRKLGRNFAYLFVLEAHKDGSLHVHLLVGFPMPSEWWSELWGLGFVHPGHQRTMDHQAVASIYAAKYVGKDAEVRGFSEHSYEVAEGFQPPSFVLEGVPIGDLLRLVADNLGAADLVALHDAIDGWEGPLVWWGVALE